MRALKSFGKFWWEFLVGDTPEFAVATVAIVGVAFLCRAAHDVGFVALPAVALGSVALSTARARR